MRGGGRNLKLLKGFTLSEVLITIGIIGVVAALTLPVLIAKYKDNEYAVRCKRTYSLINQAIQRYQADAGVAGDITGLFDVTKTSAEVLENFSKYFEVIRVCKNFTGDCSKYRYSVLYAYPVYDVDSMAQSTFMSSPLIILKDGSIINVLQKASCNHITSGPSYNPDGSIIVDSDGNPVVFEWHNNYCASLTFDTNGIAGPNKFGADMFQVKIYKDGSMAGSWGGAGAASLNSILSGEAPIYKKYSKGSTKD
ncbi:MAG: type II secretion system protein [Candidatus Gastranaerophilaceae bacterium]